MIALFYGAVYGIIIKHKALTTKQNANIFLKRHLPGKSIITLPACRTKSPPLNNAPL